MKTMFLSELSIQNFRNFENITLNMTNKNIVFGLNDIGKTNFLCAIRFLLDRDFRRNGFVDTDYYNCKVENEIVITLKIDIEDEENDDNKKIYKILKGATISDATKVYIQLKSVYNNENLHGDTELFWGPVLTDLEAIPSNQSYFEIDKLFNVVYIDSSIQLDYVFKKYARELFKTETNLDERERTDIKELINKLNTSVGNLSTIKKFSEDIHNEYKKYRHENFSISIRSEIELNNLHSKLTPYMRNESNDVYPTSGDGRRKLLAYTLLSLENRKVEEKKINIFLIEELENHLHRSMQISLSYQLFKDEIFKYLILTTHSSLIISQMDNVNLIKLYKEKNVTGKSYCYQVPKEYENLKQKLNQNLGEAIFSDTVLLVEGPSEKILFERILKEKSEKYESLGGYILEVDGINFIEYYKVLINLGIKIIVKTDNDLKLNKNNNQCNLLGLNRSLVLIGESKIENISNIDCKSYEEKPDYKKNIQIEIFDISHNSEIELLKKNSIYLSRIDLENDLYVAVPDLIIEFAKLNNTSKDPVVYLQKAKMINMIDLCKLMTVLECTQIYNSNLFSCIKELVDSCNQ